MFVHFKRSIEYVVRHASTYQGVIFWMRRRPVFLHHRSNGKSWIQKWLRENASQISKLNGRNYVPPPLTTKADISTLVLKSRPNISVAKKQEPFIIYDEMNYPVNDELYEKLKQITDKIKKSVASTPKSEYNIYLS